MSKELLAGDVLTEMQRIVSFIPAWPDRWHALQVYLREHIGSLVKSQLPAPDPANTQCVNPRCGHALSGFCDLDDADCEDRVEPAAETGGGEGLARLKSAVNEARNIIHRYRTETPPGYQPHMIADKADHWLLAYEIEAQP